MATIDLNKLRDDIHKKQAKGETEAAKPKNAIYVDKDAGISLSKPLLPGKRKAISEVQPDTFEASRLSQDRQTVQAKMPAGTKEIKTNEGVTGWVFGFRCKLGKAYQLFAYFDGAYYQVKLISPELEDYWKSAHTGHLFSNGNICFGRNFNHGRPTLEEAYGKSVIWANGISVALETGEFPFNYDQ